MYEIQRLLTNSERHDLEFLPDQFHHSALLQGGDPTAEHRAAALRQVHKAVLQVRRQGHGQGAPIDHQSDVRSRVHVARVLTVPPHLIQSAVQGGCAHELCERKENQGLILLIVIISLLTDNHFHEFGLLQPLRSENVLLSFVLHDSEKLVRQSKHPKHVSCGFWKQLIGFCTD